MITAISGPLETVVFLQLLPNWSMHINSTDSNYIPTRCLHVCSLLSGAALSLLAIQVPLSPIISGGAVSTDNGHFRVSSPICLLRTAINHMFTDWNGSMSCTNLHLNNNVRPGHSNTIYIYNHT